MAYLAGDIGGTKTLLALYASAQDLHHPLAERSFPSSEYDSLEACVRAFLAETGAVVEWAAFGVAGPVIRGAARITNLPWQMNEGALAAAAGARAVRLLNDLESIANAIPVLNADDVVALNDVQADSRGAIGVVAPGTGLGEAFLVHESGGYRAHPSEGGHCDFAPNTDLEIEMLRFLLPVFDGHVSYERVCSGLGIPNIYNFMKWSGYAELHEIEEQLAAAKDPTPVIMTNAMSAAPSPRCKATLDMFCSVLAAQAGNLALTVMATGGLYLGGGIPPRILPALQRGSFLQSFLNKGRLRSLMERVPLRVIVNAKAGLIGAARAATTL
jgi:glucokinase